MEEVYKYTNRYSKEVKDVREMDKHHLVNAFKDHIKSLATSDGFHEKFITLLKQNAHNLEAEIIRRIKE